MAGTASGAAVIRPVGRKSRDKVGWRPDFYGEGLGAWFILPDCDCFGLFLQAVPREAGGPFVFDGNYESPTFSPSVYPLSCAGCPDDGKRCHFFVRAGVAEHCDDSRYPNERIPLLPIYSRSYWLDD